MTQMYTDLFFITQRLVHFLCQLRSLTKDVEARNKVGFGEHLTRHQGYQPSIRAVRSQSLTYPGYGSHQYCLAPLYHRSISASSLLTDVLLL